MAAPAPRLRHYRTMTAVCFVCNLPILSHQVGLVWQGGNGWDDLLREQLEESTLRARLGGGRRDSAAQISCVSPPPSEVRETSPPPPPGRGAGQGRRRSSLAQLTDLLREWGGPKGGGKGGRAGGLSRRETLADLARSLPWRSSSTAAPPPDPTPPSTGGTRYRKRRDSSADSRRHQRRESHTSTIADFRQDLARLWSRRDSAASASRRGSGDSGSGSGPGRRESLSGSATPTKLSRQQSAHHRRQFTTRRRDSRATAVSTETPPPQVVPPPPPPRYYRSEQRPSTSSTASDSVPPDYPPPPPPTGISGGGGGGSGGGGGATVVVTRAIVTHAATSQTQGPLLPPPTIITVQATTPPATSPAVSPSAAAPPPPPAPPLPPPPPQQPQTPTPTTSTAAVAAAACAAASAVVQPPPPPPPPSSPPSSASASSSSGPQAMAVAAVVVVGSGGVGGGGGGAGVAVGVVATAQPSPPAPARAGSRRDSTTQFAHSEDVASQFARALNASKKKIASNWARLGRALSSAVSKWSPGSALRRVPTTLRRMPTTLRRMSTTLRRSQTLRRTWTVYGKGRAGASPERRASRRLPRQSTAIDDSPWSTRRGSQPTLAPDDAVALSAAAGGGGGGSGEGGGGRKARRDSLSPDSAHGAAANADQDAVGLDGEPTGPGGSVGGGAGSRRRGRLRRQSTSVSQRGRAPRSPESSSTCSSRDPSPRRGSVAVPPPGHAPAIRRQSTTEEILIARGFRRQSTTEEMIRCRNFRRQSSQSQEECVTRSRGRRDSSAQITDGTIASMTVETTSTFFDSSTQTEPSPLYDNNHYHEECLRCNACGLNLTGPNQARARRFRNAFFCELHFADVALMASADFMQQLRAFKPQSLGCAVARRKSSTTLIFPLPPQACSDEFCEEFPHNLIPTPGYWVECSRQKLAGRDTIWDESEENSAAEDAADEEGGGGSGGRRARAPEGGPSLAEEEEEDDDDDEDGGAAMPRAKTAIEEQWEKHGAFELTSVEQETYEKYFYGAEHWNYFTSDEDLGPVVLSIRQETLNGRDQFRILVRAISYTVHGLIPASCVFADRYNREEVVRSLGKEVNINPPFTLGQLPDTPEELLKLDQVFIKSELKVGVIYVQEGQYSEEEILDNNDVSPLFDEFLHVLGDRVRLKGFDKYKGGLDTVHDLTGLYSVYTHWRNIEIMFHVSTHLPYEKHDPQKLQRKRHIGNDIVCVVFLEADNTSFSPACIKSHFLHTFILVRTSPRIKRRPTRYEVSVVTRDEVGAYKPYLWEQSLFDKGPMFREWLLTKVVNGERASYSAPKFARMQERTRSQMLEDIVANLQNHAETGQIPKPYRRGSWRPIGHMRPSSPLLDSVRDQFEDYDSLANDFARCFRNPAVPEDATAPPTNQLFDVAFLVGQSKAKARFCGVRAILGVRSRVFQEMLYGISTGFGSPQVPVAELLARAVPSLHSPQKPKSSNFLQVPDIETPRPKSVPSSPMVKRAFSRLGTLTAGWGRSIRKQHAALSADDKKKWASSQDCSNKEAKGSDSKDSKSAAAAAAAAQLAVPRLSVCADAQKVDRAKLAQTEFSIIEFDPDTFRVLLDYLHTGSCALTCSNIPGLICAAEHYDLPELLQACFHHAKQFLRIEVVCCMLCSLENYYWRYTSASELVNMILAFVETRAHQLFAAQDFLQLSESMVQMVMCRQLEVPEVRKFEAMLGWARHRIRTKTSSKVDARLEFRCIMERLARDLKLYRISPQELIKVVLPSKAIKNERILETLMFQANSGMYRVQDSYLEACQRRLQAQDSRFSEWDSFDCGL